MHLRGPSSSGAGYSYPSSPALSLADSHNSLHSQRTTCEREPDPLAWLATPDLPRSPEKARELVDAFFVNIHSLRCFGFVHKPTVMRHLDSWATSAWHDHQSNALLLVVCALGAKFCALRYYSHDHDDDEDAQLLLARGVALSAGSQWARRAHQLVALRLDRASVEAAMAVMLLHEHDLRVGNYASAFMLTGLAVRMAQALQINVEEAGEEESPPTVDGLPCAGLPQGLSAVSREARRRLMWSIYIMDSWVGSGVDELTFVDEADLNIQLPCSDRAFESQEYSTVEMTHPGTQLSYMSPHDHMKVLVESLDLHGYFIRLVSLRRKVLRYKRGHPLLS